MSEAWHGIGPSSMPHPQVLVTLHLVCNNEIKILLNQNDYIHLIKSFEKKPVKILDFYLGASYLKKNSCFKECEEKLVAILLMKTLGK